MSEKAYCMKCKEKHEIENGKVVKMKNGNRAIKGHCSNCATKVSKIVGK